jgi:alpha-glucosidase
MLENLGLSGFAFSGADVGGFAGTPSSELLTKWIEVGTFQPIDRDHTEKGTGDQEPWVGGPEQESIRRHFIETRYQLMPYLYTLAEESSRTGLPMMRPLFLEFPDAAPDRHPLDLDVPASGEFLLGSDLLIAPPPYPDEQDAYLAELPSPDWFNFWTGEKVPHPESVKPATPDPLATANRTAPLQVPIHPTLAELPVYVRAGSIVPIAPIVQSTNETPHGPLTLRVYAGDNCAGNLYQDDGKTYAFQNGAYLRMNFSCKLTAAGLQLEISAHNGTYPAWWKQLYVEVYGWTPTQQKVLLNSKEVSVHLDSAPQRVGFLIEDNGKGATINLQ